MSARRATAVTTGTAGAAGSRLGPAVGWVVGAVNRAIADRRPAPSNGIRKMGRRLDHKASVTHQGAITGALERAFRPIVRVRG